MRDLLKKILPDFMISAYKKAKQKKRAIEREGFKNSGRTVTANEISKVLCDQGIKKGDVVMLHSSLSKMGMVEGGAETVIRSVLEVIGQEGTLAMPSFPGFGFNIDYLRTNPVFDLRNTPSKMGIITETFRKMPNVKRSLHPTEPVCALGPKADYLTKDHFGQLTPYTDVSPFGRLVELNAKILLLGVDLNTLSNLHTLEDAVTDFKFPVYLKEAVECRMINEGGKEVFVKTKVHDPSWSKKRRCNELEQMFLKDSCMKKTRIGNAELRIIEAGKMHECMLENYKNKGVTMYTPQGS